MNTLRLKRRRAYLFKEYETAVNRLCKCAVPSKIPFFISAVRTLQRKIDRYSEIIGD